MYTPSAPSGADMLPGMVARVVSELPEDVREAAHEALVAQGDGALLIPNGSISRRIWRSAWDSVRPLHVSDAEQMVSRRLTVPDVEHVIRTDTRARVFYALSTRNRISGHALELALARKSLRRTSAGATALLCQEGVDEPCVSSMYESLKLEDIMEVLAFGPLGTLPYDDVMARLARYEAPFSGRWRRNRLLRFAFMRDSELVSRAISLMEGGEADVKPSAAGRMLASPLASSPASPALLEGKVAKVAAGLDLSDRGFFLLSLAGNAAATEDLLGEVMGAATQGSRAMSSASLRLSSSPNLPPGVDVERCTDSSVLSYIAQRSLPGGPYGSPGRPERILMLARNPSLAEGDRAKLADAVQDAFGESMRPVFMEELDALLPGWSDALPYMPGPRLQADKADSLARLGTDVDRWKILLSLCRGWSGTFDDLVEVSLTG